MSALQTAELTLKPPKVAFGPQPINCIGHVISASGVTVSGDRVKAIQDFKTPSPIEELRSVLGMLNFVRRFVPRLAEVTEP